MKFPTFGKFKLGDGPAKPLTLSSPTNVCRSLLAIVDQLESESGKSTYLLFQAIPTNSVSCSTVCLPGTGKTSLIKTPLLDTLTIRKDTSSSQCSNIQNRYEPRSHDFVFQYPVRTTHCPWKSQGFSAWPGPARPSWIKSYLSSKMWTQLPKLS
jgi:hypothetical protein